MKKACSRCGRIRPCPDHPEWRGSTRAWRKLRATVIERDQGLCQIQGPGCTVIATHADHVTAKINGGPDTTDNTAAACEHCNLSKGAD